MDSRTELRTGNRPESGREAEKRKMGNGRNKETKKGKLWRILPQLAWKGVLNNGTVYYPYFGAGIFSVFTYFVFSSILHNDIISILPRSAYAWIMLEIGRVLLGIILLPFLFYANSFLIKRRKKEIGLYHILGLEKRHIGILFFAEAVLTYGIVLSAGILSGTVLSKFLFLLLLRMTGLPVDVTFVFHPGAFAETAVFFLWVYALNLVYNLLQVGKARPVELLSGGKKGEREPRFLWVSAAFGMAALVCGYRLSINSRVDSKIFSNFFLAVFWVIVGTYLLFTSGSVVFLKALKKRKGFYYRPSNFITVSGMLKRMKKNAASLSNICIFSTMVMITLTCTSSLYLGLDGVLYFNYPMDMKACFKEKDYDGEKVRGKLEELERKYGLQLETDMDYLRIELPCGKEGNAFGLTFSDRMRQADNFRVTVLLAEDYGRMENRPLVLGEGEVALYCTGKDFGYGSVVFMGKELTVKEQPAEMRIAPKAGENGFGEAYYLIVKDKEARDGFVRIWMEANGVEDVEGFLADREERILQLDVEGTEAEKQAFVKEFGNWCQKQPGMVGFANNLENRSESREMMGGLLFIGILFSLIFFMCLVLVMYYKQISEGYEDKEGFAVMQKVGMGSGEIRGTVHRQILLLFYLPLVFGVLHTVAGLCMVEKLFGAIYFYDSRLLWQCAGGMVLSFAAAYGLSYLLTAKTYYGIVSGEHGVG